ncbi:unnamed protein product, partial [Cyprideis torosa]
MDNHTQMIKQAHSDFQYAMLAANSCTERRKEMDLRSIQMDVRSPLETRQGTLQKCLAAFLPYYCHFHVLQPPE